MISTYTISLFNGLTRSLFCLFLFVSNNICGELSFWYLDIGFELSPQYDIRIHIAMDNCIIHIFNSPFSPEYLLLGLPMLMDPHPNQQRAGLQHAVWQLLQEVTKQKARFKPTWSKKPVVNAGAI